MKPMILEFAEDIDEDHFDLSSLKYSKELNLTVLAKTGEAAIATTITRLSTETMNKVGGEVSDSDKSADKSTDKSTAPFLSTQTGTAVQAEDTDSDEDDAGLRIYLETRTITEVAGEGSDSDR